MDKGRRSSDPQSSTFGFEERSRLNHKVKVVARQLEKVGAISPKELQAIETVLLDNNNAFLTVDLLHSYAHSGAYNPTPRELKDFWDNLQSMLIAIWS